MGFFAENIETAPREEILRYQFGRVREVLEHSYLHNPFYRRKYVEAGFESLPSLLRAATPADYHEIPVTRKQELLADQEARPPFGTNVAVNPGEFVRQHQTSGTTGRPLKIWETRESWNWLTRLWMYQFRALGVQPPDIVYMAFNFGHSLGMWNVLDAGMESEILTLTGGGMNSLQRVEAIVQNRATVLVCTPSYALRLAEVAHDNHVEIQNSALRMILSAGEPGASIPGMRDRIESRWGARLYDSPGITEAGHTGTACPDYGVHMIESEFYIEILDPETLRPVEPGQPGEIVITNFGRPASPVIRYRTRDIAKAIYEPCSCGRTTMRFDGGIIGRSDDMFIVRGINIFPSAIEALIRECGQVSEYAVEVLKERGHYTVNVRMELDGGPETPEQITSRLKDRLHRVLYLKSETEVVPPKTLPRMEGGKVRRVVITEN